MLEMIAKKRCQVARFALLAAFVSLIVSCCLAGAVQSAYADPADGTDVLSSESVQADDSGSGEQDSPFAADQNDGAQSGDMAEMDPEESQTTPSEGNADQSGSDAGQDAGAHPSEPMQPEPVKTAPEATPTKAGWLLDTDGVWYYFVDPHAQPLTGWVKSGGKWYWLLPDKNGAMAMSQWVEPGDGKRYYVKADGKMATGWFQVDGDWYYANKSGAQQMSGWLKSGGKWYWLQGDKQGLMFSNATTTIEGQQYSFASDGAMRANCQIDLGDGIARYAASSGAISRIGEYKDGKLVLTDASGQILTGWQRMAGKWFYGEEGTGIAQTGWLKLGKTWYYLDNNGAMVTGTRNIDGKTHLFANSGKWLGSDAMAAKAQSYASGTNWLILVDRGAHRVGIFSGSQGNWNRSQTFPCVTGAPGSQTITGVFRTTGGKRMNLSTDSRARWCTQISGGYFFHTILASEGELGQSLSHGCIRLAVPNAQWIYNNIGAGTTVVIYN